VQDLPQPGERQTAKFTAVRFPFEHNGEQIACYVIVNHQERTWIAKC
jgi:hypothetical protein